MGKVQQQTPNAACNIISPDLVSTDLPVPCTRYSECVCMRVCVCMYVWAKLVVPRQEKNTEFALLSEKVLRTTGQNERQQNTLNKSAY
jgi:hypothetical protein